MDNEMNNLISGSGEQRQELLSRLFGNMHKVPKQIVDTCVSVGGNLKLIDNGLPAPVLLPSQKANDRILSISDALIDTIVITITITLLSLMQYNVFSIIIGFIALSYWFFHIAWWQEISEWFNIQYLKEYINFTYKFYFVFFVLFYISFSSLSFFLISIYEPERLAIVKKINHLYVEKNTVIKKFLKPSKKEGIFTKHRKLIDKKKGSSKVSSTESKTKQINHFKVYKNMLINNFIFIVFTVIVSLFYRRKYSIKQKNMDKEILKELNSDLKNRQDELQEALSDSI